MKKRMLLVLPFMTLSACTGASHTHSFSTEWSNNEDYHWHECECGEKDGQSPHHFDNGQIAKNKTCTEDGDKVYVCLDCGYEMHESIPKGHTFSSEYTNNETHHWHAATCGHDEKSGYEEHKMTVDPTDSFYKTCEKCDYRTTAVNKLDTPTNLTIKDNVLSFSAVQYATKYSVLLYSGNTLVTTFETSTNSYTFDYTPGEYTVGVVAEHGTIISDTATLDIEILYKDVDKLMEAEDNVANLSNYSIDQEAHGGAYTLAFDDCGQGLNFSYYAFKAGTREVTVCYSTATPNSKMALTVEGVKQVDVVFTENTGWFGDSKTSATTKVNLTLAKGWNHISLIKDGTSTDNPAYGGNAQIDYITISGTNELYSVKDLSDLNEYSYRLEAETGAWHWSNSNQRPINWGTDFSSNYGLGEINAEGDGVRFNFKVAKSGTYLVQLCFGKGSDVGFDYKLNDGELTRITLSNGSTGWNDTKLDTGFEVTLEEGVDNSLDFRRPSGDNFWITIDYVLITLQ